MSSACTPVLVGMSSPVSEIPNSEISNIYVHTFNYYQVSGLGSEMETSLMKCENAILRAPSLEINDL